VQPIAFRLGRWRVLRRLLERDRIYQTPALHEELEVRARANLERRMRELVRVR
jgi:predicted metal-dependent HD superfamily phosphohydrolase